MNDEGGMREHDDVEAALAAALRPRGVDDASAHAAVAAFRAARDKGLHASRRTRRRDDWRPAPERAMGRSLKTALAALAASLTLGGVAFAAVVSHDPFDETEAREPEPRRSSSAPLPEPEVSSFEFPGSSPPSPHEVPTTRGIPHGPTHPPQSSEPLCRRYEKSLDKGKAMDAEAWERLVAAAHGKDVATYCDSVLTSAATDSPSASGNGHPTPQNPFDTHSRSEEGDPAHHRPATAGGSNG